MPIWRYFFPWQHRTLIWQFTRREVLGRYRGSVLGVGWAIATPLLMLAAFTFVFVGVFRARWPGTTSDQPSTEFALQVFCGLLVFNWFAEAVNAAPRAIVAQPSLVKKVVFPLETLPWVAILAAMFHMLLSLAVLLAAVAWWRGGLPVTALSAPLVLLTFLPFLLAVGWTLSALGVYLRDLVQATGPAVTLAMFLSPVFYSSASVPDRLPRLMQWNPLTIIIENLRLTMLQGMWPEWGQLAVHAALSMAFACVGAAVFHTTRRGFADVL